MRLDGPPSAVRQYFADLVVDRFQPRLMRKKAKQHNDRDCGVVQPNGNKRRDRVVGGEQVFVGQAQPEYTFSAQHVFKFWLSADLKNSLFFRIDSTRPVQP